MRRSIWFLHAVGFVLAITVVAVATQQYGAAEYRRSWDDASRHCKAGTLLFR